MDSVYTHVPATLSFRRAHWHTKAATLHSSSLPNCGHLSQTEERTVSGACSIMPTMHNAGSQLAGGLESSSHHPRTDHMCCGIVDLQLCSPSLLQLTNFAGGDESGAVAVSINDSRGAWDSMAQRINGCVCPRFLTRTISGARAGSVGVRHGPVRRNIHASRCGMWRCLICADMGSTRFAALSVQGLCSMVVGGAAVFGFTRAIIRVV